MFTHCIKPALTTQQAKELFALLGYQPASSNDEELRLGTIPVHSHALLQLACGFFIARIECHLLLTAVASLGGSTEWVLQIIQERKRGCTFQIALDRAKRKLEPASSDSPLVLDATLDLYTDNTTEEHSHMASPPSLPYIPPSENPRAHMSRSNISQSDKERNEKKAQSVSSLTCQIKATLQNTDSSLKPCENERLFTTVSNAQLGASIEGQHVYNCLKSYDSSYLKPCLQCEENHSMDCACIRSCTEQEHEVMKFMQQHTMDTRSHTRQDQTQQWENLPKDDLKQHSCINKPSNNFFFVCHDCHYIHDVNCKEFQQCLRESHNVQTTGRLQSAQVEQGLTAHTCFKAAGTQYAVCHTCNKSHDLFWNELQNCISSGHNVTYLLENNENAAETKPMPMHQCCTSAEPNFACLNCRVFHAVSCDDNQCQRQHEVQILRYVCCVCSNTQLFILCRYCCAQYCKTCWFKNPLECKCGMPFDNTAV